MNCHSKILTKGPILNLESCDIPKYSLSHIGPYGSAFIEKSPRGAINSCVVFEHIYPVFLSFTTPI